LPGIVSIGGIGHGLAKVPRVNPQGGIGIKPSDRSPEIDLVLRRAVPGITVGSQSTRICRPIHPAPSLFDWEQDAHARPLPKHVIGIHAQIPNNRRHSRGNSIIREQLHISGFGARLHAFEVIVQVDLFKIDSVKRVFEGI